MAEKTYCWYNKVCAQFRSSAKESMEDLFGNHPKERKIEIQIFADKIKRVKNARTKESWAYAGALLVPLNKKHELLEELYRLREKCECISEIKGNEVETSKKRKTAEGWIDLLLSDAGTKRIYFNILGINLTNLNPQAFGRGQFSTIYNRFFRTTITSGINCCFYERQWDRVIVDKVLHDVGDMQHHDLFPWHAIWKAGNNARVSFRSKEIEFIDSDHRKPGGCEESHLIQLIDLILGSISQCLDYTSTMKSRCQVASKMLPLLERMIQAPNNPHSQYGHYRKYVLSFFPSRKLSGMELLDTLKRSRSGFYKLRPIVLREAISRQSRLPLEGL